MPDRVQLLSEDLANKIAAGEVVERPASVVKELVENAIDAGARSISVVIHQGGLKRIEVLDDGWGMSREDALMSLERHATSKIRSIDDLFSIHTLGFRGEALPSIASVSRFTLVTRQADDLAATRITVQGTERQVDEVGAPTGTRIMVDDLFYNTPARLKFMKTIATEGGHVAETVTRLAISHPEVAIGLVHDDRMLLSTPGNNSLWDVLLTIYGKEVAKGLTAIEAEHPSIKLDGYVGQPQVARSNRLHEHTMVNGRYVRSRTLQHAVEEAYRNVIPPRRYPLVALRLTIDPEYVDVNVHPAKTEVRFRHDSEVHQAVLRAVRRALAHASAAGAALEPEEPVVYDQPPVPERDALTNSSYVQERLPEPEQLVVTVPRPAAWTTMPPASPRPSTPWSERPVQAVSSEIRSPEPSAPSAFPPVRVISQLSGTYILAQAVDAWLIIDQHAAHERILYEEFKAQLSGGQISTQLMMVPLTLELTGFELERMRARVDDLEALGYVIEPFGTGTLLVRGVPQILGEGAGREALIELMDEILRSPKAPAAHELANRALITMSCKGAIKANQWLPVARQEEIIQRLGTTPDYATCPHGRPTYWWLSHADLDKHFLRS